MGFQFDAEFHIQPINKLDSRFRGNDNSQNQMSQGTTDVKQIGSLVQEKSEFVRALFGGMDKVIIGQRYMLEQMLIELLANGHILLEGVPGLAKTMAVTILSRSIDADFRRTQFTPDLLPADLIGTQI